MERQSDVRSKSRGKGLGSHHLLLAFMEGLMEMCVCLSNVDLRKLPGLRVQALPMTRLHTGQEEARRMENTQGSAQIVASSVQSLTWECVYLDENKLELLLGGPSLLAPLPQLWEGPTMARMVICFCTICKCLLSKCSGDSGPLSL